MTPAEQYMVGAVILILALKGIQVMYNHRSRKRAWEKDARLGMYGRKRRRP